MSKIKKQIEKAWKNIWNTEEQEDFVTPASLKIVFELKYKDLIIGTLELNESKWIFKYSEIFKGQDELKPLPDFPNIDKVYMNEELYPFFLIRIPSLKQPRVQKEIEENQLDSSNAVELLKHFGRKSIANPFDLLAI